MTTAPPSAEPSTSPSEPVLEAKLDPKWQLAPSHLTIVVLWILLFLLLSYTPLRSTDLWGHVMYGRQILDKQELPQADPFLPLAKGMPVVDGAWLSQVIFAWVEQHGGTVWLSSLFALSGLGTYLILARAYYLQARHAWVMMTAMIAVVLVGNSRLLTIRPETFAALCFSGLLWLIVSSQASEQAPLDPALSEDADAGRRDRPWRMWVGVPVVFLLWANLHGSFVCGIAVLGCYLLGRVIEVAWKKRDLRSVIEDREARQWLLWTELAVVATLINPYGIDLWLNTLAFSRNENLREVLEWQPLVILGIGGLEFAVSWVALTAVLRHSRQPMPVAHVLMLGVFAIAALFGIRMLTWYAMVFGLVLTPHLRELAARWSSSRETPPAPVLADEEGEEEEEAGEFILPAGRSWAYSLIALMLIWMAFALSPSWDAVRGKQSPLSPEKIYGSETPLGLTQYLRENPPQGQIYNPQWWGDWLVFDGPKGLQPFVTSNIHLVPRQVWRDYMSVLMAQADWRLMLDKYAINTVVLDKAQQENLISLLRRQQNWRVAFNDEQALVFTRVRTPAASSSELSSGQQAEETTLDRPVEAPEPEVESPTSPPAGTGESAPGAESINSAPANLEPST